MAYRYFTRDEWGAAPPTKGYTPVRHGSTAVIHHTADATSHALVIEPGRPGKKWYRLYASGKASLAVRRAIKAYEAEKGDVIAKEKAAMRAFQSWHQKGNGWTDIGYHYVIFPSGHVYQGRPVNNYGAHAIGGNSMIGYSIAGNYDKYKPSKEAIASLKFQMARNNIKDLIGHYDVPGNSTSCPGRYLRAELRV